MKAVVQRVKEANVLVGGKSAQGRSASGGKVARSTPLSATLSSAERVAQIGQGLLVLLGVAEGDTEEQVRKLARKITDLRIMADQQGKMNLSIRDVAHSSSPIRPRAHGREVRATLSNAERVGGEILVISQFTLLADTSRGHRPSFIEAAEPAEAEKLYKLFVEELKKLNILVKTGKFGEYMQVALINDGPVTIVLEA